MLKKFLVASILTLSLTTAMAETYTPQQPDCSKDMNFIMTLQKQGFEPLFTTDDILHAGIKHMIGYNSKTKEILYFTKLPNNKVCLEYIGAGTRITEKIDNFKAFVDDSFKNSQNPNTP